MLGSILLDVKIAFRVLIKAPGFTLIAILTLSVAIGANTAIFSVVDAVLLRPLAFPDAEEIVTITLDASGVGVPELPFSDRGYWHFKEQNRSFDDFGGFGSTVLTLTGNGEPTHLSDTSYGFTNCNDKGVSSSSGYCSNCWGNLISCVCWPC